MYEELVKKIRHCATEPMHCLSCGEDKDGRCFKRLMTQAADAIEKLTAYVRQSEELRKDGYYLQKTKMMTYGQATMTMPMPEPPKEKPTCEDCQRECQMMGLDMEACASYEPPKEE